MSDVSVTVGDKAEVDKAALLLKMRKEGTSTTYRRPAVERKIKEVPDQILTLARAKFDTEPPKRAKSVGDLSPMEQTLMTGALEKATVEEAVRQIYDNMFTLTGWTYNASQPESNGLAYTKGGKTEGMCESYRNAFNEALNCYDSLRENHPNDAIKSASLDHKPDDTLVSERFCTRQGLTLMGNGLKGNVYLKVNAFGTPLDEGIDSIKRFVFKGHWTLKVNGVAYDPIFHSIGEDNVEWLFGPGNLGDDGSRFIPNTGAPTDDGEFGATFIWVTDWEAFESTVDNMKALYTDNKTEVDQILAGTKTTKDTLRTDRRSYRKAKELVKESVGAAATFREVARVAGGAMVALTRSQVEAVGKILDLAAK